MTGFGERVEKATGIVTNLEIEGFKPGMESCCHIEMLGALQVVHGGERITRFARQKAGALLAYLALYPRPQPREHLVDLFWPEMDLPAGRDNLSTTLGSLRRQLEPPGVRKGMVLEATTAYVRLKPEAITTDVAAFERLIDEAAKTEPVPLRADLLEQAVALYRGDLLPGIYQDWAIQEMNRLQGRFHTALDRLAQVREALGDAAGALEIARRLAAVDAYSEEAHCRLVRLLILNGKPDAAHDAHRRFEQLLKEEFGAAPSAQTRRTLESLFAVPAASRLSSQTHSASETRRSPAVDTKIPSHSVIPAQRDAESPPLRFATERATGRRSVRAAAPPHVVSRIFGREAEIAELLQHLLPAQVNSTSPRQPEPTCRLATLIGTGGIGKTRLALEFARQVGQQSQVWCGFIPLADLTGPEQIVDRVAASLKLVSVPGTSPFEQIVTFFQNLSHALPHPSATERDRTADPSALLILDNLEHLLRTEEGQSEWAVTDQAESKSAAGFIRKLLEDVPGLAILCTSRSRLGLRGERLFVVRPLSVPALPVEPPHAVDVEALAMVPGIRLYLDRARAVRPDFGITPTNAPAIVALCRQLEGIPLALELAASWVRTLPPRKMWERLSQGEEIPAGSYSDLPERHRSLSSAMEWSFQLLSSDQQRLFVRLAVFQGGWTAEAAEVVCDQPNAFDLLCQLQEASLITVTADGDDEIRYSFLETIGAFSRHRLEVLEDHAGVKRRHVAYYSALAENASLHLRASEQASWLARLEVDRENFRAALEWCLHQPDEIRAGLRLGAILRDFWQARGHLQEGRNLLERVLARASGEESTSLYAWALHAYGQLAWHQGDFAAAQAAQQRSLAIFRMCADRSGEAAALGSMGDVAYARADYTTAFTLHQESLDLRREANDRYRIVETLTALGNIEYNRRDYASAQRYYEESRVLAEEAGSIRHLAFAINNLGILAKEQQHYAQAHVYYAQGLALQQKLGDRQGQAITRFNLAEMDRLMSAHTAAHSNFVASLTLFDETGDRRSIAYVLEGLAELASSLGQWDKVGYLYAAAQKLRQEIGAPLPPSDAEVYRSHREAARHQLGQATFDLAWSQGTSHTLEQVIASVREVI